MEFTKEGCVNAHPNEVFATTCPDKISARVAKCADGGGKSVQRPGNRRTAGEISRRPAAIGVDPGANDDFATCPSRVARGIDRCHSVNSPLAEVIGSVR